MIPMEPEENDMPRIQGSTIILREFRQEDLPSMRKWINNEAVTRYLGVRYVRPQTWEQTEDYLRRLLNGDVAGEQLVIADIANYNYLGQISLQAMDSYTRQAELALVVAPEYWGKGVATQAIPLMLRHAFCNLNLNRVWLKAFSEHSRALHVYEKLGFVREGTLRADAFLNGRYRDTVVMGMLKDEFFRLYPQNETEA